MRAWLGDDVFAWLARTMRAERPSLFLAVYLLTLLTYCAAAAWFARGLGASWWVVGALLLLLTLKHQIARTGANSLEGYMHPRMLAFALGVAALGFLVRQRHAAAWLTTLAAGVMHPTTALWFGVVVTVAFLRSTVDRRHTATLTMALPVVLIVTAGTPVFDLRRMDPEWLAVLADKTYLFPSEWPLSIWAVNLSYPIALVLIHRRRRNLGATVPGEAALVLGLLALVALFLLSVPLSAARVALAVQLQISRIFWLLDFAVTAFVAWWLLSLPVMRPLSRRVALLVVLGALSLTRGAYVLTIETGRPLVQRTLPETPWTDAMNWLSRQPSSAHVLADPGHAWKYGVGIRQAASKDTFLESIKDSAMAMYDREVAMRVAERSAASTGFDMMTTGDVRALDDRYGFDLFVVEGGRPFELPVLYRNARFVIYDLR
jgi:hypothetical protein